MTIDYKKLSAAQEYPIWNHTPEDILKIAKELIQKEKDINDYLASVENPTYDNVLKPFAKYVNEYSFIENQICFYQSVSTDKALRDASTDAEQLLEENSIEQSLRIDVFKVFKKLYEAHKNNELEDIDDESKRYLEKTYRYYTRSGLDLPEEKREKVKELRKEMSTLSVQFSKNMNEEKEFVLFTLQELEGVPEEVINQFEKIEEGGVTKYKMTFKYPDLFPVLKYAKNQATRRSAYISNQNKCPENALILEKIVQIRYQLAKILGYDTYASYVIEEKMAKTQKNVMDFLLDLKEKLTPLGKKELENMLQFKNNDFKERGLLEQDTYYAWDANYYNERLLEKEYKVDHTAISEYFPMDSTIEKMLGFYETLFDIKFVKNEVKKEGRTWHEDVKQFAVFKDISKESPVFVGWIYLDLHPREGKYGHAANFGLGPGYLENDNKRHNPLTVLVCNFTKPTVEKPSLLKHDEVTTFFHELGHGVHFVLSQTRYARFHGTRVERDFVEAPSQLLEFWTWSKNELKSLTSHYKTGEQINDHLVDQLIKSKNVNSSLFNLRQLHFGLFDMKLHCISNEKDLNDLDMTTLWNSLREEIALVSSDNNPTKGFASFGHIAGGYEAGYYGYLYSQVFANDIYYTLFKDDPMNVKNGLRYRDIILKRGGSKDSMDNLVELLGRKPNSEAFLKELLGN